MTDEPTKRPGKLEFDIKGKDGKVIHIEGDGEMGFDSWQDLEAAGQEYPTVIDPETGAERWGMPRRNFSLIQKAMPYLFMEQATTRWDQTNERGFELAKTRQNIRSTLGLRGLVELSEDLGAGWYMPAYIEIHGDMNAASDEDPTTEEGTTESVVESPSSEPTQPDSASTPAKTGRRRKS